MKTLNSSLGIHLVTKPGEEPSEETVQGWQVDLLELIDVDRMIAHIRLGGGEPARKVSDALDQYENFLAIEARYKAWERGERERRGGAGAGAVTGAVVIAWPRERRGRGTE